MKWFEKVDCLVALLLVGILVCMLTGCAPGRRYYCGYETVNQMDKNEKMSPDFEQYEENLQRRQKTLQD